LVLLKKRTEKNVRGGPKNDETGYPIFGDWGNQWVGGEILQNRRCGLAETKYAVGGEARARQRERDNVRTVFFLKRSPGGMTAEKPFPRGAKPKQHYISR